MTHYLADEALDPIAAKVLRFWFGEGAQYGRRLKSWFDKDAAFDARCREGFLAEYDAIAAGVHREWLERRADCVARIVLLDQFPRNMFRGSAKAFATDPLALESARIALARGFDTDLAPVEKLFVYLPFEHSETLDDQLRACELMRPLEVFPETDDAYRYAVAHKDIIARFGRFPHRNSLVGRESTPEELEFLRTPGSSF
jgi:uncharacterized protein (DUF924 family)